MAAAEIVVPAKKITQGDVDRLTASLERPPAEWNGKTPVIGQPCPCCGRKVQKRGLSGAERQRKYRAKNAKVP